MSHDDAFAAFQERKRATEAAEFKVTWRRATWGDKQGWSGLGPEGRLLYVRAAPDEGSNYAGFHYGDVVGNLRTIRGSQPGPTLAKRAAEAWLRRQLALSR